MKELSGKTPLIRHISVLFAYRTRMERKERICTDERIG